ncbi:hypothetical protein SAMN05446037_10851 [Anaerovirgula multivorans]|uniref:Transposase n=1 Tax=Anaerovirgula multivorans TaxID=312168 RepID=A0A239LJH4_9FIRM|nr:hypothetical protein [Anaerovirgula multivorans]SNT30736.1 hypothetical protein SAMN05446037_10851 [Anaerovirgula multivorans]
MSKEETRLMWIERIEAYRLSGLSAKKWCEENEINFHALSYWSRKFKKEKAATGDSKQWLSVEIPKSPKEVLKPNSSTAIKVQIGVGTIEVEAGFDAAAFKNVVRILSEIC